eukprot:s742_g18.t1
MVEEHQLGFKDFIERRRMAQATSRRSQDSEASSQDKLTSQELQASAAAVQAPHTFLSFCKFLCKEAMDVHYWRECPMLTQCHYCKQVIEIATLGPHLRDECEGPGAAQAGQELWLANKLADLGPTQCPLCMAEIGSSEEDWRRHILQEGCAANPRGAKT